MGAGVVTGEITSPRHLNWLNRSEYGRCSKMTTAKESGAAGVIAEMDKPMSLQSSLSIRDNALVYS